MKPNLDLIREILIAVGNKKSLDYDIVKIEGYSKEEIGYNSKIIIDEELAEGSNLTDGSGLEYALSALTLAGAEFLEAAKDKSRWEKAKGMLKTTTTKVTVSTFRSILVKLMTNGFTS